MLFEKYGDLNTKKEQLFRKRPWLDGKPSVIPQNLTQGLANVLTLPHTFLTCSTLTPPASGPAAFGVPDQ